jgi:hypothetical protein
MSASRARARERGFTWRKSRTSRASNPTANAPLAHVSDYGETKKKAAETGISIAANVKLAQRCAPCSMPQTARTSPASMASRASSQTARMSMDELLK